MIQPLFPGQEQAVESAFRKRVQPDCLQKLVFEAIWRGPYTFVAVFESDPRGLTGARQRRVACGFSKCRPGDKLRPSVGVRIALVRALRELEPPLLAKLRHPDEIAAGMNPYADRSPDDPDRSERIERPPEAGGEQP